MRSGAFRRHQEWKHKQEAIRKAKINDWGYQYNNPLAYGSLYRRYHDRIPQWEDPRAIGKLARTPHPCSCLGCGNLREFGGVSRQELWNILDTLDELREMGYNVSILKNKPTKRHEDVWSWD